MRNAIVVLVLLILAPIGTSLAEITEEAESPLENEEMMPNSLTLSN